MASILRIVKPEESGSMFYNYKGYYSLVLLAVADANYNFVFVDVGAYGKDCDSSVFKETSLWNKMQEDALNLPAPRVLPGMKEELPYVLVGDEAFSLHTNLLRPFGGRELDNTKCIFNYRLSRARRFVECAFGILTNKWRIFHRPLNVSTDFATDIVKACCVLQNYIHKEEGFNSIFVDTIVDVDSELHELIHSQTVHGGLTANANRNKFAAYFVSEAGKIPWQNRFA